MWRGLYRQEILHVLKGQMLKVEQRFLQRRGVIGSQELSQSLVSFVRVPYCRRRVGGGVALNTERFVYSEVGNSFNSALCGPLGVSLSIFCPYLHQILITEIQCQLI